jgi:hypothetical protein
MAADTAIFTVGAHHHGHGVPADDALDAPLNLAVTGESRLAAHRDGVDIGRVGAEMRLNAIFLGAHLQQPQQFQDPFRPLVGIDIVQGFDPFPVFYRNLAVGQ